MGEFFDKYLLCHNVEIALKESIIKMKGTVVGLSGRLLKINQNFFLNNEINGKSENIPIILVIAPKFMGKFLFYFKN